jgi:hypothetical protein
MEHHSQGAPQPDGTRIERMPGYGTGLKFPFLYRGRHFKHEKPYGKRKKSDEYREIEWAVKLFAWTLVGFSMLLATRLREDEAAALVGFTAFFCLLGTVGYYFSCTALLIVIWRQRAHSPGGLFMLAAFFGTSAFTYWVFAQAQDMTIAHNTALSTSLLVYLMSLLTWLGVETRLFQDFGHFVMPTSAPALWPIPGETKVPTDESEHDDGREPSDASSEEE